MESELLTVIRETEMPPGQWDTLPQADAEALYAALNRAVNLATRHRYEIDPELRVLLCDRQGHVLERAVDFLPDVIASGIKHVYSPAVQAYRRWYNPELMKDKGLAGYTLARVLNAHSVMFFGTPKEDYPYLDLLPEMEFLLTDTETGVAELYYRHLNETYTEMDALMLDGLYAETIDYLYHYRTLRPDGKVYCGLDMNSYWMSITDWSADWCRGFFDRCDLVATSCRVIRDALNRNPNVSFPCRWLPNGFFNPTSRDVTVRAADKRNIIMAAGRIGSEEKNHMELLLAFAEAAPQLEGWTLRFAGPLQDGFLERAEGVIARHPPLKDRVVFTGAISNKAALYEEYARAKIFAHTSFYEGGAPNVYAEALAHGCRIVVSGIDAAEEMTNKGELGISYPGGDINALACALVTLSRMSAEDETEEHIAKTRAYQKKYFDWGRNAKKLAYMLLH